MFKPRLQLICAVAVSAAALVSVGRLHAADDIVDTAVKAGSFNTLAAALKAADLVDTLKGKGPFTVFAPTDEAFAKLPKGTVETLLKPQNKAKLVGILTYHAVSGAVPASQVVNLSEAATLNGQRVKIKVVDKTVLLNDSKVIKTDIRCSNGIIHVIDSVLLPPEGQMDATAAREMIQSTVFEGAHLFNAGHHAQCAQLYMSTMKKMIEKGQNLPEEARRHLTRAVDQAGHAGGPSQQAWTLRHGLDGAYLSMNSE